MEIERVFAVACVSDIQRSEEWYARFMGRAPDDRPMEGLVQWRSTEGGGLQLVQDREKSGNSLVTLIVPAMDRARRRLADASLLLEPSSQGDYGVLAQIRDPDGNLLTLAEPPKGM